MYIILYLYLHTFFFFTICIVYAFHVKSLPNKIRHLLANGDPSFSESIEGWSTVVESPRSAFWGKKNFDCQRNVKHFGCLQWLSNYFPECNALFKEPLMKKHCDVVVMLSKFGWLQYSCAFWGLKWFNQCSQQNLFEVTKKMGYICNICNLFL